PTPSGSRTASSADPRPRSAHRTVMPSAAIAAFASASVICWKWNTLAASTASAPACTAGAKCSGSPAPPEAISGRVVAPRASRISSRSKPCSVPSALLALGALPGAVGVHRGRQDLAGAALGGLADPGARVGAGAASAAVGGDLDAGAGAGRALRGVVRDTARVDRQHQHLVAAAAGDLGDHLRAGDRRGGHTALVGPGAQQLVDVLDRAPDRKG